MSSCLKPFHIYRYKQTTRGTPIKGSPGTNNTIRCNNFLTRWKRWWTRRSSPHGEFHPEEGTRSYINNHQAAVTGYFFFDFEVTSLFCFFPDSDFTEPPTETSSRLSVSDSSSPKSGNKACMSIEQLDTVTCSSWLSW